jgi:hypothetical protein
MWKRVSSAVHCSSRCASFQHTNWLLNSNQAYRHVFTSPTSVTDQEVTAEHLHKRRKTVLTTKKSTIAVLTNLREVTPRSIAYIAVQVCTVISLSLCFT